MAIAANLSVALSLNSARYRQGLDTARRQSGTFSRQVNRSLGNLRNSFNSLSGIAAGIFASIGVGSLVNAGDTITNIENLLRSSGFSASEVAEQFAVVQSLATRTRGDLAATGRIYATLTRNATELGASQQDIAIATQTVQQAFALGGASAAEAAGSTRQLAQALASGTLRGDELNSVLENAPEIARLITRSLGVTTGQLREMAAEGRVTSDIVFRALLEGAEGINERFGETNATFGQLGNLIATSLTPIFGEFANMLRPVVSAFANFAAANPGLTASGLAIGAVTLALGILIPVLAPVAAGIGLVGAALLLNPIGQAITAITIAVTAGVAIWKNWDTIVAFITDQWNSFGASFPRTQAVIVGAFEALTSPIDTAISLFTGFGNIITNLFGGEGIGNAVRNQLNNLLNGVADALERLPLIGEEAAAAFRGAVIFQLDETVEDALNRSPIPELILGIDARMAELAEIGRARTAGFRTGVIEELDATVAEAAAPLNDLDAAVQTSFQNTLANAMDTASRLSEVGSRAFDGFADALTNFVTTGMADFAGLARSIIADLIKIQIQAALAMSLGGGGFLSNLFGGLFAEGGRIRSGQVGIVGEAGPEFVRGPATVTSAVDSAEILRGGGGGGSSSVTFNVSTMDASSFDQYVNSPRARESIGRAMNGDSRDRGFA